MTDASTQGFEFNRPTIVALLVVIGAVTALPILVSAVLAYVWRGDSANEPWEESHYRFHIRGFWMMIIFSVIAFMISVLTLFLLAPIVFGAIALWLIVRGLIALQRAQRHEPIANPLAYLW